MSEERLIRQCAPTLAGLKTGSLFPCPYGAREELMAEIRAFNRRYGTRGLCLLPVRAEDGHALLYLYRPAALRRDLQDGAVRAILVERGYCCESSGQCLTRLVQRLRGETGFPHEIGLFLSYPSEDVRGFMENRAENCKVAGLWKVYGDEKRAERLFEQYRACTKQYCLRWQSGASMDELAVAG